MFCKTKLIENLLDKFCVRAIIIYVDVVLMRIDPLSRTFGEQECISPCSLMPLSASFWWELAYTRTKTTNIFLRNFLVLFWPSSCFFSVSALISSERSTSWPSRQRTVKEASNEKICFCSFDCSGKHRNCRGLHADDTSFPARSALDGRCGTWGVHPRARLQGLLRPGQDLLTRSFYFVFRFLA